MNGGIGIQRPLNQALAASVEELLRRPPLPEERMTRLRTIAEWILQRRAVGETARLVFICTHNSRRSHLAQVWAQAAAWAWGLDRVETYSGGTEATAFYPGAVEALRRAGFEVDEPVAGPNPVYRVGFAPSAPIMACFSKVFDQPPNPSAGFAAVMTCSSADEACPVVAGADLRVATPYADPKAYDGRADETARYDERSRQIGYEMLTLFAAVAV